jgi:hypothetical protein
MSTGPQSTRGWLHPPPSGEVKQPHPPAAQELQPQLCLRKGRHAPEVANDTQTLWQLDVGAQALQQLLQHGLRHSLSLR